METFLRFCCSSFLPPIVSQPQPLNETLELQSMKGLHEDISYILLGRDVVDHLLVIFNRFSDKMVSEIDMFGMWMEFIVFCQCYHPLVITVKLDGSWLLALDLNDETSDPQCFFGCMCLHDVFGFSTWQHDDMLPFWTPCYHSVKLWLSRGPFGMESVQRIILDRKE